MLPLQSLTSASCIACLCFLSKPSALKLMCAQVRPHYVGSSRFRDPFTPRLPVKVVNVEQLEGLDDSDLQRVASGAQLGY